MDIIRYVWEAIRDHPYLSFVALMGVIVDRAFYLGEYSVVAQMIMIAAVLGVFEISWRSILGFGVLLLLASGIAASFSEVASDEFGSAAFASIVVGIVFGLVKAISGSRAAE